MTLIFKRTLAHLNEVTRKQLRPYSEEAVRTLAQVLAGPERSIYHAESSSQKGKFYTLEVVGVDVTCDCPASHTAAVVDTSVH